MPMEMSPRDEKRTAVENFPGICRLLDYFRLPSLTLSQDVENLEQAVEQLNQEGRTVILITHDDSIARSAQRIIRIQDGKIAKNCALAFIDNSPDYAIMDAGFEKAKTLP